MERPDNNLTRDSLFRVLRKLKVITCRLPDFQYMLQQCQFSENGNYAINLLRLISDYSKPWILLDLQHDLQVGSKPWDRESLLSIIQQLFITKDKIGLINLLRDYYQSYQSEFIFQLADCLRTQHLQASQVTYLCLMLDITSIKWLEGLFQWCKNNTSIDEWDSPLLCLSNLLCYESACIFFSNGQLNLSRGSDIQRSNDIVSAQISVRILKQLETALMSYKAPSHRVTELLRADMPVLLPRSRVSFFCKTPQSSPSYEAVITYQSARVKKSSVDCQEYCHTLFSQFHEELKNEILGYQILSNPLRGIYKLKLINNNNVNVVFTEAMKALSLTEDHVVRALDLSENWISDREVVQLCLFLQRYDHCRVLKLSHNNITIDGLSSLVMMLRTKPSIKYLLLDHNWISFNPHYCENLLQIEKTLGLLNLDVSMNFIPQGALIDGNILADLNTLRSEFKEQVDVCSRLITQSLIVHSQCTGSEVSFLRQHFSPKECDQVFDKITPAKGCVGCFAYLDHYLHTFGTHSFLVIERIHPIYGQRQLIMADLIVVQNQIIIRSIQVTPGEFLEHIDKIGKVGKRLALADVEKINKLLEIIYASRDVRQYHEYQLIPMDEGKVNCHKIAIQWMVEAGIIPKEHQSEWLHVENKMDKEGCVIF